MAVDAKQYLHPSDKKALTVLKAMPGFALLARTFIKFFQEKPAELLVMGNCIKISENQYPDLYHLLPPICERLGIEEPELFVMLSPEPNGFTIGDRKPIIVVTSGLMEMMSLEDIAVVLAHECGHIACHHVLYRTIGLYLTDTLQRFIKMPIPVSLGIQVAMQYWMRCSELSADRASAICAGGSDRVIRLMMAFSGGSKRVYDNFNVSEYMKQAEKYKEETKKNVWSRIVNLILVADQDHPFTATRSLEIYKWCESQQFQKLLAE